MFFTIKVVGGENSSVGRGEEGGWGGGSKNHGNGSRELADAEKFFFRSGVPGERQGWSWGKPAGKFRVVLNGRIKQDGRKKGGRKRTPKE